MYAYYYPSDLRYELKEPNTVSIRVEKTVENPILIDTFNGEVYELEESEFKGDKVYNVPLKEYPLIITDKKAFEITKNK